MPESFDPKLETYKTDVEGWKIRLKYDHDWRLESFKAIIQFALAAARGIVLANGGAAIAILAFLGNIWSKEPRAHDVARDISLSLKLFLIGIAAGVGVLAAAYMAQSFFTVYRNKTGLAFQAVGLVLAIGGLAMFIVGALDAANVFATHFPS